MSYCFQRKYPPHPAPKTPHGLDLNLIRMGLQDDPCLLKVIQQIGSRDAHKKGSFHPAHNSGGCSGRTTVTTKQKMC